MAASRGNKKGNKNRKSRAKQGAARQHIPVRAVPAEEICLQCGMCCDGTLFSHIQLNDDEHDYVRSLGFELALDADGEVKGVREPCPAFRDGCCSYYLTGRPATCGTYTCRLVRECEAGQRSLDDALTVVELLRTVTREIEPEIGLPFGGFNREAFQDWLEEHEPWNEPDRWNRLLIAVFRYNLIGGKYFFSSPKPMEAAAGAAGAQAAAEAAGAVSEAPAAG